MVRFGLLASVLAALSAAGCRSTEPPRLEAPVPGSVRVSDLDVPDSVRPLILTVYPTAQRAEYAERLLPFEGATFVDDTAADFDVRLRAAGLDLAWKDMHPEGYLLSVSAEEGHAVVLSAARDDAGRRWADQALAQLEWEADGRRYVRECRVLDEPVFALRGSKRPQSWELRYRANFAWGARDDADFRGRQMTAVFAPGMPLDATGPGVARALESFRPWQDRGVRLFAVKFDDEGFALTPESEFFYGRFAPALVNYLRLVRQGLRRRNADARLYLLPQTYWWNDPRFDAFAASIRAAGGLDEDLGIVLTGPEVVSDEVDARQLAAARRSFGLTETNALVYDNLGREGDWGPLVGRDPQLWRYVDGVFGERGTPVNRLTRLDWLWNPEGYDPERSWRRALLELAGPQGYERFEAICGALRRGARGADVSPLVESFARETEGTWKGPVARRDLVALLRTDCSRTSPPAAATRGDVRHPSGD